MSDATVKNFNILLEGHSYLNGFKDACGPMTERAHGVWLDQHGGVYHPDGTQWGHHPESAGNLYVCLEARDE